jgi:glycosyltransferase involved in cell wall biosynthesis
VAHRSLSGILSKPNVPSPETASARIPVVRVITRLNIGGPAIQAATLSPALEPLGFDVTLVHGSLSAGEGDMSYLVAAGTRTVFVPWLRREIRFLDDLHALIALYRVMRNVQPRIVHTHMAKAGLLGRLAAVLYNLRRGHRPRARIVHTYHGHVLEGYFGGLRTRLFIALERLLARASDALVAIAPPVRDELLLDYGIGRAAQYHLVPLGFDLAPFAAIGREAQAQARRELNIPGDAEVITTVGRLTAIKDQSRLLAVAREVAGRRPRLVLLIVGDGELRAGLEAEAAAHGLGDHVRFLGWRRDLPTIYAATDVFVLTSRNEGTPVALIEAMASGVPGVSTDVGGVATVIENESMGIRVPLGDNAGFVAGVLRLLDSADREAMGARARAHVLERFERRRLVSDIARLYRRLLEES